LQLLGLVAVAAGAGMVAVWLGLTVLGVGLIAVGVSLELAAATPPTGATPASPPDDRVATS
jgi:hypothetical protein